jgi:putative transposase
MTHDYVRHGTTTLFAAMNVLDGAVIGLKPPTTLHVLYLVDLRERGSPLSHDI